MKITCFAFVIAFSLAFAGCDNKEVMDMPGIYKMDSVSVKTAASDTTYRNTNQLKIYTPEFMMYADVNDGDSVSRFGIGSYVMDKDTLTENVLFSANDSVSNDKPASFKLVIEKTKGGYKQFIYGMDAADGSKYDLTEFYTRIGSPSTSVLDGAWKQVNAYSIVGTDTARAGNNVQFKLFHSGYVMWGHSVKDSLNRIQTGVGYGKFTMTGDTKLKESMMASTYSVVTGHDFEIDVELMGANGFKQTITNKDGRKDVEFYERLKK